MDFEAKRKRRKKKPLNQERRMKKLMEKKPKKERGEPIPSGGYWDEGRKKPKQKRQDSKSKLRKEYVGSRQQDRNKMDRNKIASELVKIAKELMVIRTAALNLEQQKVRGSEKMWVAFDGDGNAHGFSISIDALESALPNGTLIALNSTDALNALNALNACCTR